MMFTEALFCRLFVFSPLICEAISSQTLEHTVFVFRILISMFPFVPVWIVDVKYPFCSLAGGLKLEAQFLNSCYFYSQG